MNDKDEWLKLDNQDTWLELNYRVWLLLEILRRNRHKARLEDFDAADREDFIYCEKVVDLFLWKVSLHQTHQVEAAATVVTETRFDLFAMLHKRANGWLPQNFFAKWTIDLHRPNLWLFLRAREQMRRLRKGLGAVMTALRHDRLPSPVHVNRDPDPVMTDWTSKHCPIRYLKPRERANAKGVVRRLFSPIPPDHCLRACDLLLLHELAFTLSQIEIALGVKSKTIWVKMLQCEEKGSEAGHSTAEQPVGGGSAKTGTN